MKTPDYDGLAADARLSSFHFHRMFAGMVGRPPWNSHGDCGSNARPGT